MRPAGELIRTEHQLVLFESVARHRSVGAVAAELDLTPRDVSRSLRRLEVAMGTALFMRHERDIRLSDAGEILFLGVSTGIAELRRLAGGRREGESGLPDESRTVDRTPPRVVDAA